MQSRTLLIYTVLLVMLCAAPANPQGQTHSIPGCYTLVVGSWSGPFPSGWAAAHQPPDTAQLHAEAPFEGHGWRLASPHLKVFATRQRRFPPRWRSLSTDSVEVVWSSGFAGVRVLMQVQGERVSGTASAFHDVVGPGIVQPTAPVTGMRVPCPESPQ